MAQQALQPQEILLRARFVVLLYPKTTIKYNENTIMCLYLDIFLNSSSRWIFFKTFLPIQVLSMYSCFKSLRSVYRCGTPGWVS